MTKSTLFLILMTFISITNLDAQGWVKIYDDLPDGQGEMVEEIPNGYRIKGQLITEESFELLTDLDGDVAQFNIVPDLPISNSIQLSDGNILEFSTIENPDPDMFSDVVLTKKMPDGTVIWTQTYPEERPQTPRTVIEMPSGELMVLGLHHLPGTGLNFSANLFVRKTDATGNTISNELLLTNVESYHLSISEIFVLEDKTPLVYYEFPAFFNGVHNKCGLIKLDADGNEVWKHNFGEELNSTAGNTLFDIRLHEDGAVSSLLDFSYDTGGSSGHGYELKKWANDGTEAYSLQSGFTGQGTSATPNIQLPYADGNILLVRRYYSSFAQVNQLELKKYDGQGELIWENAFPFTGNIYNGFINESQQIFLTGKSDYWHSPIVLIAADSLGNAYAGNVTGQIFIDENNNCEMDSVEIPYLNNDVNLTFDNEFSITNLDTAGMFDINAFEQISTLYLNQLSPYFQACQDSFLIELIDGVSTIDLSIGIQAIVDCPLLKIQSTLTNLRPCMPSTYQVVCQNIGSTEAEAATLQITLPGEVAIATNSLPILSQNGNEFIFEMGDLAVGSSAHLTLNLDVDCDTPTGENLCFTAHAFPDTVCLATVTDAPYFEEKCRIVTNSFDPNRKTVFPQGEGANHWLSVDSTLQYLIEFQNTGTDTAFRVVLKDTLSAFLDLASIQAGPSSHAYTWEILQGRTLKFTFDNIMLPDSNVNEALSHGFVQFEIDLKEDVLPHSIIENTAAIFFDFNDPIITNTVFHTILKPVVYTDLETTICSGEEVLGTPIFQDTLLIDSLIYPYLDSVFYYNIEVLSDEMTTIDTTLQAGDFYNNIPIFQDTILIENLLAVNGCDSTVFINISILTATNDNFKNAIDLSIFPNPVDDQLFINLNVTTNELFSIKMVNLQGQTLIQQQFFNNNEPLILDCKNISSGIYFIIFEMDNQTIFRKVMVE